jgi:hypothetical protein
LHRTTTDSYKYHPEFILLAIDPSTPFIYAPLGDSSQDLGPFRERVSPVFALIPNEGVEAKYTVKITQKRTETDLFASYKMFTYASINRGL